MYVDDVEAALHFGEPVIGDKVQVKVSWWRDPVSGTVRYVGERHGAPKARWGNEQWVGVEIEQELADTQNKPPKFGPHTAVGFDCVATNGQVSGTEYFKCETGTYGLLVPVSQVSTDIESERQKAVPCYPVGTRLNIPEQHMNETKLAEHWKQPGATIEFRLCSNVATLTQQEDVQSMGVDLKSVPQHGLAVTAVAEGSLAEAAGCQLGMTVSAIGGLGFGASSRVCTILGAATGGRYTVRIDHTDDADDGHIVDVDVQVGNHFLAESSRYAPEESVQVLRGASWTDATVVKYVGPGSRHTLCLTDSASTVDMDLSPINSYPASLTSKAYAREVQRYLEFILETESTVMVLTLGPNHLPYSYFLLLLRAIRAGFGICPPVPVALTP